MTTIFQPAIHFEDPAAVHLPVSTPAGFVGVWVDEDALDVIAGRRLSLGSHGYAAAWCPERKTMDVLHRVLMGCEPGDGVQVDHINGDRLDCRRANLRRATPQENAANRRCNPASGYRGVVRRRDKWAAYGRVDGRTHHLGTFTDPEEAALVAHLWRLKYLPGYIAPRDGRDITAPAPFGVAA